MSADIKDTVSKEDTFDKLDIRLGRVVSVEPAQDAPRPAYKIAVDFGRFGVKTTVGRFTRHADDELIGQLVMGVLNFPPRPVGGILSEFLLLGVQYPKADSGEATFITPAAPAKIGSKLF